MTNRPRDPTNDSEPVDALPHDADDAIPDEMVDAARQERIYPTDETDEG